METIRISQSEASTFTTCPKKFVYSHVDNLEPNKHSEPLAMGTLGHYFIELILKGTGRQEALEITAMKDPLLFSKIAVQLNYWMDNVWAKLSPNLDIIATEVTEYLPIGMVTSADGTDYKVEFPFTIDAVVRTKKSKQVALWDHKFVSQFYDDRLLALAKQMRLYAYAYGKVHPDLVPSRAFYNMISTKNKTKNVTSFKEIDISNDQMLQTLFNEQVTSAIELAKIKVDNLRGQRHAADPFTCKWCPFLELCTSEIKGEPIEDIRNILKTGFRKNSYGY